MISDGSSIRRRARLQKLEELAVRRQKRVYRVYVNGSMPRSLSKLKEALNQVREDIQKPWLAVVSGHYDREGGSESSYMRQTFVTMRLEKPETDDKIWPGGMIEAAPAGVYRINLNGESFVLRVVCAFTKRFTIL